MSKDIWHTTDEAPKSCVYIAFYVDGYLYSGCYEPQYNQYGIFGADKVEKWCYIKELSPYILALEAELERTRKALDVAKDAIRHIDWFFYGDYNVDAKTMHNEIKCAIKGITALEQKEHFADASKMINKRM